MVSEGAQKRSAAQAPRRGLADNGLLHRLRRRGGGRQGRRGHRGRTQRGARVGRGQLDDLVPPQVLPRGGSIGRPASPPARYAGCHQRPLRRLPGLPAPCEPVGTGTGHRVRLMDAPRRAAELASGSAYFIVKGSTLFRTPFLGLEPVRDGFPDVTATTPPSSAPSTSSWSRRVPYASCAVGVTSTAPTSRPTSMCPPTSTTPRPHRYRLPRPANHATSASPERAHLAVPARLDLTPQNPPPRRLPPRPHPASPGHTLATAPCPPANPHQAPRVASRHASATTRESRPCR